MKKFAIFAAVMMIGASVALASTLTAPFFRDLGATGGFALPLSDGQITIKDSSGSAQVITIIYTALNASNVPVDQTVTAALGANQALTWQPVQDSTNEGKGQGVANMTIASPAGPNQFSGSVTVIGVGLSGRYAERRNASGQQFGHVLLPQ